MLGQWGVICQGSSIGRATDCVSGYTGSNPVLGPRYEDSEMTRIDDQRELRDEFVKSILCSIDYKQFSVIVNQAKDIPAGEAVARYCYNLADALLKERGRRL